MQLIKFKLFDNWLHVIPKITNDFHYWNLAMVGFRHFHLAIFIYIRCYELNFVLCCIYWFQVLLFCPEYFTWSCFAFRCLSRMMCSVVAVSWRFGREYLDIMQQFFCFHKRLTGHFWRFVPKFYYFGLDIYLMYFYCLVGRFFIFYKIVFSKYLPAYDVLVHFF